MRDLVPAVPPRPRRPAGVGATRLRCLALALALAMAGCAAERRTPAGSDAAPSALQQRATDVCCQQRPACDLPPREFSTDACTLWPDGDWVGCCEEHDIAYWCGGSDERRAEADARFRACVALHSDACFSTLSYLGVRIGGVAWLPTAWRWGYGWDWLEQP